jgi:hypothetical protein
MPWLPRSRRFLAESKAAVKSFSCRSRYTDSSSLVHKIPVRFTRSPDVSSYNSASTLLRLCSRIALQGPAVPESFWLMERAAPISGGQKCLERVILAEIFSRSPLVLLPFFSRFSLVNENYPQIWTGNVRTKSGKARACQTAFGRKGDCHFIIIKQRDFITPFSPAGERRRRSIGVPLTAFPSRGAKREQGLNS